MGGDEKPPASLRFAGYASIFHEMDAGRDVVMPGAFDRALREGAKTLPLLWQHEAREPIGRIETLATDGRGLRVIGSISLGARRGQDAASLIRAQALTGLSIGYRVRRSAVDGKQRLRRLLDVDLLEISLVTFPMQPRARVLGVETAVASAWGLTPLETANGRI
ncbi:HK97 family phage prohead protease [Pedomonas mirosovicensis]|uniref:HK97 family phage prohead protease n=1 Tax=Pedomonas mirosovicensis TaxID=2908641 RepID=UPI002168A288|nr:HK97 family phage prohead protease [Pedomonas mirosovicensis]MCH8684850.1 HK97 family phage prohead protease [Pedomonas mirosovicensis]